jgi:hypothetical protein
MEKDERIKKMEENIRELIKLHKETAETDVLLTEARKNADESKVRSELYSRLEKASGVKISSAPTDSGGNIVALEQKMDALLKKEMETKKQILTSLSDESKFPFGIEKPMKKNENTIFSIKKEFQIENDILKTLFGLVDANYPARFDNVVIDAVSITVEKEEIPSAVNKAADALEKLRTTARTLSEVLFDENKLKSLCETIHSSEKSYKPIVEEIGNNCPNQVTTRKIAETRNMNVDAVSSISSMLVQGKNWAGKCSILKRTAEGGLTFNSLGRAIWSSYQKLYAIPQKVEQHCTEEKQKSLFNFSEE